MKSSRQWNVLIFLVMASFAISLGCAKGMFWKTGHLAPWARTKWAEEEKIADTLFVKKRRLDESAAAVKNGSAEAKQLVARELAETMTSDSVLLLRRHAVKLLGELDSPAAIDALEDATRDYNADMRIAAIEAWRNKSPELAIPQLQNLIGSDTNIDVRLAATRALGGFSGDQAIRALGVALNDPDPALQLRAADSLRVSTGQPFGRDIVAWQGYLEQHAADPNAMPPATRTAQQRPLGQLFQR